MSTTPSPHPVGATPLTRANLAFVDAAIALRNNKSKSAAIPARSASSGRSVAKYRYRPVCSPVIFLTDDTTSKTRKTAGGGRNGYFVASQAGGSGFESRPKLRGFRAQTVSTESNIVAFVPRPNFHGR